MSMLLLPTLAKIPVPLFGTAATLVQYGRATSRKLPGLVGWAFPVVVGGMWFVWPAVDEEWKQSIGLGNSNKLVEATPAPPKEQPQLDAVALAKVQMAYKADAVMDHDDDDDDDEEDNEDENMTMEEIWDRDLYDPGDVDDDDDDDDDDEDEEDEDEEDDE